MTDAVDLRAAIDYFEHGGEVGPKVKALLDAARRVLDGQKVWWCVSETRSAEPSECGFTEGDHHALCGPRTLIDVEGDDE